MSYILDALRRADAERQQGQVPGLHAAPAADLPLAQPPAWRPAAWWLAGTVLLVALGGALWLFWRAAPAPVAVPVAAAQQSSPPATVLALPPALPIVVSAAPMAPAPVPAAGPGDTTQAPPTGAPRAAAPSANPSAAVTRTLPLASLPSDERRQLPALVPGGSVWSDSAASRFVILDGQVLREGDAVAPGVVLERIERKAAVLRWKDQRLEVPL